MRAHWIRRGTVLIAVMTAVLGVAVPADALHSWGGNPGYHWARETNPFTLRLGDNVGGVWDGYLGTTSADWSQSVVLDTSVVPGVSSPRKCAASLGSVQVCNSTYGANGWLGLAQVWISGSHITQGTVKVNDTYFNTATYNTVAWRNLVMCQEVGHTLGLGHQDEDSANANLNSCMDYTNKPFSNQHPNQHDYEQLALIYGHGDTTTTVTAAATARANATVGRGSEGERGEWGQLVRGSEDARSVAAYQRELPDGEQVFTFVIWA